MLRTPLAIAAFVVLATGAPALSQPLPDRPEASAPAASASIEAKQAWCDQYVAWYIAHTPAQNEDLPPDVRPTHRTEVELQSCALDPQLYERQTVAEVATPVTPT